ncbi:hypothetical protein KC19_2G011600 [Ceratodon purpureus]|uniref:Uncharacterized protein n=1 Tax=Ceratodon purpureus TaxID=3225 RepID=A0A8T0IRL7_CERPU|nr:hypothetical protein KC19_2G011600 [Ceratodon purpureus]
MVASRDVRSDGKLLPVSSRLVSSRLVSSFSLSVSIPDGIPSCEMNGAGSAGDSVGTRGEKYTFGREVFGGENLEEYFATHGRIVNSYFYFGYNCTKDCRSIDQRSYSNGIV